MKENKIVQKKSYNFAVGMVKLCRVIVEEKREYILSKQLLRSGTSIGANVEEAIGGQSRRDFVAKLTIAYKKARETHYWLRLLQDAGILEPNVAQKFGQDCEELLRILTSILRTLKLKQNS